MWPLINMCIIIEAALYRKLIQLYRRKHQKWGAVTEKWYARNLQREKFENRRNWKIECGKLKCKEDWEINRLINFETLLFIRINYIGWKYFNFFVHRRMDEEITLLKNPIFLKPVS